MDHVNFTYDKHQETMKKTEVQIYREIINQLLKEHTAPMNESLRQKLDSVGISFYCYWCGCALSCDMATRHAHKCFEEG